MINPLRHLEVFKPLAFGQRRVDVIGVGASGSRLVLHLARLGLQGPIHVWDPDIVEEHNIANQAYRLGDIGRLKVEALADLVKATTDTDLVIHPEAVDGTQRMGDIVFLLTDSMASRRTIWAQGIKRKPYISLLIETRMGPDTGRVYTVNPGNGGHIAAYEGTFYEDPPRPTSACGATTTVGPTAEYLACLAVWQLIRWAAIEQGAPDEMEQEIIFGLRPTSLVSNQFPSIAPITV